MCVLLQFQSMKLPAYPPGSCSEAEKPDNRAKNRYRNILPCMMNLIITCFLMRMFVVIVRRYGDSVDNTVEENSIVFSRIQLRWLPSARACGSKTLHQQNAPVLNWRCWLIQVDLYNGREMVVVFVDSQKAFALLATLLARKLIDLVVSVCPSVRSFPF